MIVGSCWPRSRQLSRVSSACAVPPGAPFTCASSWMSVAHVVQCPIASEYPLMVTSFPRVAPNRPPVLPGSQLSQMFGSFQTSLKDRPPGRARNALLHGTCPLMRLWMIVIAAVRVVRNAALEYGSHCQPATAAGAAWPDRGVFILGTLSPPTNPANNAQTRSCSAHVATRRQLRPAPK